MADNGQLQKDNPAGIFMLNREKTPGHLQKRYSEADFNRLLTSPHTLSFAEFDALAGCFGQRLSLDDHCRLVVKRLRLGRYRSQIEKNTLLACIEGRGDEAARLQALLGRRNALGLRVV